MTPLPGLPDGLQLVRTTPEFERHTIPGALLAAHRTAPNVWGRLVVRDGNASLVFDDQPDTIHQLSEGDSIAIAPQRPHRVIVTGPVRLVVEFHRAATDTAEPLSAEVVDLDGTGAMPSSASGSSGPTVQQTTRNEAIERVEPLLTGSPSPHFYTVVSSADRGTPSV